MTRPGEEDPPRPGDSALAELPPAEPMSVGQWATYLQYLVVWEAVALLPDSLAPGVARRVGAVWHRFAPRRQRRQVAANQARAAGHPPAEQLDRLVRRAYEGYARYWIDAFRAHRLDVDDVLSSTTDEGTEIIDEVRADGRGAIVATGHIGSWDIGAFFSTARGWRLAVVAEVLQPRRLFERFVRLRENLGLEVVPLVRGGDMVGRLEAIVRDGGTATLLADRDLTKKGPVVEFFGEPCRLPPGPAALARRTGRPVIVGGFLTTPTGWRTRILEPVDVAKLDIIDATQVIAEQLERLIGEEPEQWHVFVPNWLADREPEHPLLQDADAPTRGRQDGDPR